MYTVAQSMLAVSVPVRLGQVVGSGIHTFT